MFIPTEVKHSNDWNVEYYSSATIPVYTHTHTHIITLHYTCCHDEIKGPQDFKIYSHPDSLILALQSMSNLEWMQDAVRMLERALCAVVNGIEVDFTKRNEPSGTTLCAALFVGTWLLVVNVGDSRATMGSSNRPGLQASLLSLSDPL